MTSPEERIELVRQAFAAYAANDYAFVADHLDPEVEIYAAPEFMNTGTWHGYQGWIDWTSQWNEAWDSFEIEIQETEPVGANHVVIGVRQTGRGRTSGVEIAQQAYYLFEVRDGRCTYLALLPDRASALAQAREREGG